MLHFPWVVGKIDESSAAGGAHARRSVQDLVDALLALEGRGTTHMVFGLSVGSLHVSPEQRAELIARVRAALLAKRDAFVRASESEIVLEMASLAATCGIPELGVTARGLPEKHHPAAPWLRDVFAGIVVVRGSDDTSIGAALDWFQRTYRGPDFGGLDVMRPNTNGDAWLLVGRWTDCFHDDVQAACVAFLGAVEQSIAAVNSGMGIGGTRGETTLSITSPQRATKLEIVPWHAYQGEVALRSGPVDPARARWMVEAIFPQLPQWAGMHMSAPHWLGHGVNAKDGRLLQVTPYVRADIVPEGRLWISALAAENDFTTWLHAFLAAVP